MNRKHLLTWILLAPLLLFLNMAPANSAISTGGGNTFGATTAADKAIPRFNGTSGKLLQDSSVLIDDTNAFDMPVLGSTPANPAASRRKLYWKGTTLYGLASDGTETAIGGGSVLDEATVYNVGPPGEGFDYTLPSAAYAAAKADGRGIGNPAVIVVTPGTYADSLVMDTPQIHVVSKAGSPAFKSVQLTGSLTIALTGGTQPDRIALVQGISFDSGATIGDGTNGEEIALRDVFLDGGSNTALTVDNPSGNVTMHNVHVENNDATDPTILVTSGYINWKDGNLSNTTGDSIHASSGGLNLSFVSAQGSAILTGDASLVFNFAGFGGTGGDQPVLNTTSTGFSLMAQCTLLTSAVPAVVGSGTFAYAFLLGMPGYDVTNALAGTLNSGAGGIPLPFVGDSGSGGIAGSNIFWDDTAIRLGLGTILPNYTLNLNRSGATDVFTQWTNGTTGTTSSDGLIAGITAAGAAFITQTENSTLTLATNNTDALTIQADQDLYPLANIVSGTGTKVGLGITTTPNYPLQIYRTDGTGFVQWTDSTSGSASGDGFLIGTSAGVGYITQQENADIRFATNNLDRMYLLSTGDLQLLAAKDLRLSDSDSSNYVGFKSPATVSANKIWTLPDADGSAGQKLVTDGSGLLSWSTGTLGHLGYFGSPGTGSTNTAVMRYSTARPDNDGGLDLSYSSSASLGDSFNVLREGNYTVTGTLNHSCGALHVFIMVGPKIINSVGATEAEIKGVWYNPGSGGYGFSATFHAAANDKIYINSPCSSVNNTYSKLNEINIVRNN